MSPPSDRQSSTDPADRRSVLSAAVAGITIALTGCTGGSEPGLDEGEQNKNQPIEEVDMWVRATLVDDPPGSAPVTAYDEEPIADDEVLQDLLEAAADCSEEKNTATDADDEEYEYVPATAADYDLDDLHETRELIDELPEHLERRLAERDEQVVELDTIVNFVS